MDQETLLANQPPLADRFRLLATLGQGANGTVYKASDLLLPGECIALKLIFPHAALDHAALKRFRREIIVGRKLRHPNIAELFEFSTDVQNRCFLVMEFVEGESLAGRLARADLEPLTHAEIYSILADIAEGLAYAHSQNVVHRDCKPQNILLTTDGRAKVTDFGIARLLEDDQGLTRTGECLGTPYYMSPEQFRGEPAAVQSDIYAFAIIALEIMTGKRLYEENSYYKIGLAHLTAPVPNLRLMLPQVPSWLREFLAQALKKDPKSRPRSLKTIADLLRKESETDSDGSNPKVSPYNKNVPAHRRRIEQRRLFRRLLSLGMGGIIAIYISANLYWMEYRMYSQICGVVLRLENVLGLEMTSFRVIFNLHASLARPYEFIDLVRRSRTDNAARADALALIQAGIDVNMKDNFGTPAIIISCLYANAFVQSQIADSGADLLAQDAQGKTCAHRLVESNITPISGKYYLSSNSGPVRDNEGQTFLHSWVRFASAGQDLLPNYETWPVADVIQARNNQGLTALQLAMATNQPEKALRLIKMGAAVDDPFPDGTSLRDFAVRNNFTEVLAALDRPR